MNKTGGGYRPSFILRKPEIEDTLPLDVEPPSQMSLEDLRDRFLDCKRGRRPRHRRPQPALTEEQAHQKYLWDLAVRAYRALKIGYQGSDQYLSRVFYQRALIRRAIASFVKNQKQAKLKRRLNRREREVSRMFQQKVLLSAWRKAVVGEHRIGNAINRREPLSYCVKFSEYCKCESC